MFDSLISTKECPDVLILGEVLDRCMVLVAAGNEWEW